MNCRVSQPATFDSLRIAGHLPSTFVPTAGHFPGGQPGGGGGGAGRSWN